MSERSDSFSRGRRESARRLVENPTALPDAAVFALGPHVLGPVPRPVPQNEPGRVVSSVFAALVKGEADMVGFVAYGLYKQSKRDWLIAFEREHGRSPSEVEIGSYIVGEGTERRLATYRSLAEQLLVQRGIESGSNRAPMLASPGTVNAFTVQRRPGGAPAPRPPRRRGLLSYLGYLVLFCLIVAAATLLLRGGLLFALSRA